MKWVWVAALLLGAVGRTAWADDANIKLSTNDGSTQFGIQNSAGVDVVTVNSLGAVQISSNTVLPGATFYHNGLIWMGGSPSISLAVTSECNSAAPTLGAGSSNYFGTITCITLAATNGVAGIIATVTPTVAAPHAWICTVVANNVATASAIAPPTVDVYVVGNAATWVLESTAAMAKNNTYGWNYTCTPM